VLASSQIRVGPAQNDDGTVRASVFTDRLPPGDRTDDRRTRQDHISPQERADEALRRFADGKLRHPGPQGELGSKKVMAWMRQTWPYAMRG
jgi:hypothetical protein